MTPRLFLDADGTIVDSSRRQYELYRELVGSKSLSYHDYWSLKRAGHRQSDLLARWSGLGETEILAFQRTWLERIEDAPRLKLDEVFPGVPTFLSRAQRTIEIIVVSGRQSQVKLQGQLSALGVGKFIRKVIVLGQYTTKEELLKNELGTSLAGIFVGDSREDIRAGSALGLDTVAVSSGETCESLLMDARPNYLFGSLAEVPLSLLCQSA